ncbi:MULTISPECIES: histidinol-phosphate transaminase [unclassified Janthinobacterium]|uniref:Histidinol-phosphate aminotransferase n=1 Tax=Janthinobacterium lividum TaxID=29581 RepID=A0A1E8PRS9_9BURK|nr:histidinol-phosphate transaminase [Janthinobacterium sp. CG_23.4]MCL6486964.1 histidinol-phosphate transaminase [Janthinobacterium lividum]MDH6160068.1 histidinol-phosphate aminotransferase [Janthinobacterium sp. CG_23.4]OFJ48996.1 histidinol-phosphate transaminase [Janthinobacterium lividum]
MSFLDQLISNTVRSDVRAVKSYQVVDASGYIKLDAMENPYLLPQHLREELGARLTAVALNRYPPSYASLQAAICAKLGVPAAYDVMLGNGSDELISILAMACARQEAGQRAVMLAPVPAFVMYARSAQFAGMDFVGVPLQADFSLDMEAMLAAIEEHRPSLVFLAYPNNPTGNLFASVDIERILAALGDTGIAVVDEAYEPFAQHSFMGRLPEFENLVVMRTVSKLGLAGIRLGYMSAAPALLAQFEKVRPPYNVNVLTQAAAEFALEHIEVLNAQADLLNSARDALALRLAELPGVTVFPSKANFLLIRVADSDDVCAKLLARRVLIKNMSKMHAALLNCLRISVSTPEENSLFYDAFKASLV